MWLLRNFYLEFEQDGKFDRAEIGNNCLIGMNALIVPEITIGDNRIIGAGAIVTHDIPSGSIAVGASVCAIEAVEEYAEKKT